MRRTLDICQELGIDAIVWDDCAGHVTDLQAPHRPRIQVWMHDEQAEAAGKQGFRLIESHSRNCYLDMNYHSPQTSLWAGHIDTNAAYGVRTDRPGTIGVEATIWTEHTPTPADLEWHLFPRLCAIAERGWNPNTEWANFRQRLRLSEASFISRGLRYYADPVVFDR
jgi:hexosaminidase